MSNIVEKILKEIEKGNLKIESIGPFPQAYQFGLPHCPCLGGNEVTGFDRRYDSLVCLG